MALKTYVLLEHTKPSAPIYIQAGKHERVNLDQKPNDAAYLQLPCYNPKLGMNRMIRLKLNSNTPWQDEQIEKEKILANEKFTDAERRATRFNNGVNITTNEVVQKFLEVSPQFEGSDWTSEDIRPLYRLLDKAVEIKSDNEKFKLNVKAAVKITELDLKGAQDLLIRLNGSFFKVPETLEECQNLLVDFLDNVDNGASAILKEDTNVDDEVTVLIGRLINEGIISFDAMENQVAKKKGKDWIALKEISNEYTPEERKRYFSEFLTSENGKLLHEDLKKEIEKKEKKAA